MQLPFWKRALFSANGFTLIEMLITVALIGIIAGLLTPKLAQMQQEALRQTARQQAKSFESALAQWYNAQDSSAAASATWDLWDTADGTKDGCARPQNIISAISPYMTLKSTISYSGVECYTTEMAKIPLASDYISDSGTVGPTTSGVAFAHLRFYWYPSKVNSSKTNDRFSYAPQVVFYLPSL